MDEGLLPLMSWTEGECGGGVQNQLGCTTRSSTLKQKKYFSCVNVDRTTIHILQMDTCTFFYIFTFSLGIPIMDRDCNEQISLIVLWGEKLVLASQNFSRFCLCVISLSFVFFFLPESAWRSLVMTLGHKCGMQSMNALMLCPWQPQWMIGWVGAVPLCAQV